MMALRDSGRMVILQVSRLYGIGFCREIKRHYPNIKNPFKMDFAAGRMEYRDKKTDKLYAYCSQLILGHVSSFGKIGFIF